MPRLLRLFRCHMYGSLARGCGGILFAILHNSPFGGSTLITSAPKSDKITAAPGPAMKLARSTTFSPEKMLSASAISLCVLLVAKRLVIREQEFNPRLVSRHNLIGFLEEQFFCFLPGF